MRIKNGCIMSWVKSTEVCICMFIYFRRRKFVYPYNRILLINLFVSTLPRCKSLSIPQHPLAPLPALRTLSPLLHVILHDVIDLEGVDEISFSIYSANSPESRLGSDKSFFHISKICYLSLRAFPLTLTYVRSINSRVKPISLAHPQNATRKPKLTLKAI